MSERATWEDHKVAARAWEATKARLGCCYDIAADKFRWWDQDRKIGTATKEEVRQSIEHAKALEVALDTTMDKHGYAYGRKKDME